MKEPLATYSDVRVDGRRRFDLYADRVVLSGKTTHVDFETTIKLSDLYPRPKMLWIGHGWFRLAGLLFFLSFLALIGAGFAHESTPERERLMDIFLPATFGFLFAGLFVLGSTCRKVKFLRFNSHLGITLLDVACSGPDRDRFDSFIEELTGRISANQGEVSVISPV